jgi:hypothetical protein
MDKALCAARMMLVNCDLTRGNPIGAAKMGKCKVPEVYCISITCVYADIWKSIIRIPNLRGQILYETIERKTPSCAFLPVRR